MQEYDFVCLPDVQQLFLKLFYYFSLIISSSLFVYCLTQKYIIYK